MTKELIGRVCIKLSGRESNKIAVIVDKIDKNFVLIDGNVKRRKCNLSHLELTGKLIDIKKNDTTEDIHKAMEKAKIKVTKRKEKKEIKEKPSKKRKEKKKPETKKEKIKNEK